MLSAIALSLFLSAEPLLVKSGDHFSEGVLSVISRSATSVQLRVLRGDPKQVADSIRERLGSGEVSVSDAQITIKGQDTAILDKLAQIQFETQPMLAMESPEAGGSVRVGRTAELPMGLPEPKELERFRAKVLHVSRGAFPDVTLKLRILAGPKDPELAKKFKKMTYMTGRVALAHKQGTPDFANQSTQRNLVGAYLRAGDEVIVHAQDITTATGPDVVFDFVERK